MQLIGLATNAVGEKQDIALLPRDVLGGKLVTSSGCRHIRDQKSSLVKT